MLQRYRDLFAVPGLRRTMLSSVAGRLPIGITGLAILLFIQGRSGSFALAGTASALYVLGLALIAPLLGRLIDRLGPRPVLSACALMYPAALIALASLVFFSAHPVWICAAAVLAGATLPPVSSCVRALYPRLVTDPALLPTTYSIDSAFVELVFILGPALVALCVAIGRPEAAILLAALSAFVGTAFFMRAPAVRQWAASPQRVRRDRLGVLRYPRLLVLFAVTMFYSMSFGLFEVAATAHAAAKGAPAVAGVALALASVGSAVGAIVYGARHWRPAVHVQLVIALVAMASGIVLLSAIDNLLWFSLANLLTGIPMSTVIATQSLLISRYSPRERLAEAFTWSASCLLAGVSAGIAAGGALAEVAAAYWLLLIAAASTALAAVIAMTWLRE
jgi:MFS family permease